MSGTPRQIIICDATQKAAEPLRLQTYTVEYER